MSDTPDKPDDKPKELTYAEKCEALLVVSKMYFGVLEKYGICVDAVGAWIKDDKGEYMLVAVARAYDQSVESSEGYTIQ